MISETVYTFIATLTKFITALVALGIVGYLTSCGIG